MLTLWLCDQLQQLIFSPYHYCTVLCLKLIITPSLFREDNQIFSDLKYLLYFVTNVYRLIM